MAWTELTRRQHARAGGKYASDLTDSEWALIAPFLPGPKITGRPRTTSLRDVFDAILYMATTGCQWRMLPNDFPPVSTVRGYFYAWRNDGFLDEMNCKLVEAAHHRNLPIPPQLDGDPPDEADTSDETGTGKGTDLRAGPLRRINETARRRSDAQSTTHLVRGLQHMGPPFHIKIPGL